MFIQVVQGKVRDQTRLQECMDRWQTDLMPGAIGYLGTTAGLTDDGTFIALARFESAEAAQANSDRPEQGEWWAETSQCFDGEVQFMNCNNISLWMTPSDEAGFVQIMEGRSSNPDRLFEMMTQSSDRLHEMRPEVMGGTFMKVNDQGDYVEAIYFTSEEEARKGEKLEVPDDLRAMFEQDPSLAGDVQYFDLHHPRLVTARQ